MGGTKKEFLPLKNGTVLSSCAVAFLKSFENTIPTKKNPTKDKNNGSSIKLLQNLVITIPEGMQEQAEKALFCDKEFTSYKSCPLHFVTGSSTRQKSIFNALEFLRNQAFIPDYVLIHDGARPFVDTQTILHVTNSTIEFGAAAPGFTPTDTIKEIDKDGFITRHLVRSNLISIQTPQGFEFERIFNAHQQAAKTAQEFTDDSEIWDKFCGKVKITQGNPSNKKITYPGDIDEEA